jgi:ATP-dependent DNA helicase RecQ
VSLHESADSAATATGPRIEIGGEVPTHRDAALAQLRKAIADPAANFRDGQWEAIDALVNQRKRLLVVQRTGWGKSAVYFIATRLLRDRGAGPTLIVSPLLALMRNQLEAARRLGIDARRIDSTNQKEWPEHRAAITAGRVDALLISPERLGNESFVEEVLLPIADRVGLLVVDEAHCISDWGHDFRPDYRRIVGVLQRMPSNMPVLGTTATANSRVIDDVVDQLGRTQVLRGSLMRETLWLQATRLPDQTARLAWLAEHVPELPGTGIVYTLTKRDAEQVATWLTRNGITARAYYSDVESPEFEDRHAYREHLEGLLLSNQLKALVATTALGMGYDKPDLGFVVHYQTPGSVVGYYQQVGRAGRAISRAVGIPLSGQEDEEIHEYFRRTAFPSEEDVASILAALERHEGLTRAELESELNIRRGLIDKALKFLSMEDPSPVLKDGSRWLRTPVEYQMDHERIRRLTSQREREWQEVQDYVDIRECRMVYLARALDDPTVGPCGRCSSCLGAPVVGEGFDQRLAVAASQFLRHAEMPLLCKVRIPTGALPEYGFSGNLPQHLRPQEGRILARWGDAGWGRLVRDGKRTEHFGDELVGAVAAMFEERWRPSPAPTWVTCVPSLRHPDLVPAFARRLADRLGLPFVEAVTKERDNEPQKRQENSYHQCRNLDGAFGIAGVRSGEPVLLVDDMVDSTWTLAIVSALLLRAGSGPVWPIALASTSAGD